jgi:nitroreductase
MNLTTLIKKARSFRRFDEATPITETELRQFIDTVRLVPSAGNTQTLRYMIIPHEKCHRLFPHLKWAGFLSDWDGPEKGERPTGYIILLAKGTPSHDVGIAGQTLQLLATEAGYGACMFGSIDREKVKQEFSIPNELSIQLIVAFGKPAETIVLENGTSDALQYWRDENSVHHVPKLQLEDILIP